MENFRGNFFDSYQNGSSGELRNQYYDPFFVKHRKRTTKTQLKVLEQTFETNIRPDANMRKKLGEQLGMTPRSVQVWFQNRRAKIKKLTQKKGTQENSTNRDSENKSSPAEYKYYHPYAPVQSEDFDVYPADNSIYKHAKAQMPVMYEGYGFRAQDEHYYPRYGEYYPPYAQWQPSKDDEYYHAARKQYRGGAHTRDNM